MNNKKPNPIGIILIEMLGCEIKELKPEVDQCSFHSVSEEQLDKMLLGEITMPWRINANLCEFALKQLEGWEDLNCEEEEVPARLAVHLLWFLMNMKKHILWQKLLQALTDVFTDILTDEEKKANN
jgi:hypothetical protein